MKKPIRIQRKRTRGFNLQAQSPDGAPVVSVCRPGKWGNPYTIDPFSLSINQGQHLTLAQATDRAIIAAAGKVVFLFRAYVTQKIAADASFLEPLRGKHLACFCPLDSPCHADVLLELANA